MEPIPNQDSTAANTMAAVSSQPIIPQVPQIPAIRDLASPMPELFTGVQSAQSLEDWETEARKHSGSGGGTDIYASSEVNSERYPYMLPGANNEDLYGSGQAWYAKAFNGVTKGLALTGTTFVNSTVGLAEGAMKWSTGGKFSDMWDNATTRAMDDANSYLENSLPNYYTSTETNSKWYSPNNLLTANFVFDKFIKNLGFVAGAALAGGTYSSVLKAIGLSGELAAAGQLGRALTASEEAMAAGEGVTGLTGRLMSASKNLNSTANVLDKTHRILTAGIATTGEAAMESLNTANEYRQAAIAKYKEENGIDPDSYALAQIDRDTEAVGNSSMLLNMALLTATNYIQFNKILNTSYKAAKSVDNALIRDVTVDNLGKWGMKEAEGLTAKSFDIAKRIVNTAFSPSEAFEEVSQYAIEQGTQNYWNKHHRQPGESFLENLMNHPSDVGEDIVKQGYKDAFSSKEGLESLFLGGISGGIVESFMQRGENRQKRLNTQAAITDVNSKKSVPELIRDSIFLDKANSVDRSTTLNEELQQQVSLGNEKRARDLIYDDIHNTLSTRIKYGAYDQVHNELNNYRVRAATPEGFNDLQAEGIANSTDTAESFTKRINYLLKEANHLNTLHEALNLKYGGIRDEDGNKVYSSEDLSKMLYAAGKINNIDERSQVLTNELLSIGIDPTEAIQTDYNNSSTEAREKLLTLPTNQTLNPELKARARQAVKDLSDLYADRKTFAKEYEDFMKKPQTLQQAKERAKTAANNGSTTEDVPHTEVKTHPIIDSLKEGEDYYLGGVDYKTEKGNLVRKFPRFTVVKKNSDGTVTIREATTGNLVTVGAGDLSHYKIGSVKAVENNKTAAYYLRHINDIYQLKIGKGKTVSGRLDYDSVNNDLYFVYLDEKGNLISKPIGNEDLVAKKGYREARLTIIGTLEVETAEDKRIREQMAAEQEANAAKRFEQRREIMNSLIADTADNIQQIEESLVELNERADVVIASITALEGATPTLGKDGTLRQLNSLYKEKVKLEKRIEELESQKNELEYQLEYFKDVADNIEEYPVDIQAFGKQIRGTIKDINTAIDNTEKAISSLKKVIKNLNQALTKAFKAIKDAIVKFSQNSPNREFDMNEAQLEFVLHSKPEILDDPEQYNEDTKELDETLKAINELKLVPSKVQLSKAKDDLKQAQSELVSLRKDLGAAKVIYNKFKTIFEQYQAQEQARLDRLANAALQQAIFSNQKNADVNSGIPVLSPEEQQVTEQEFDKDKENKTKEESFKKPINILFSATTQATNFQNTPEGLLHEKYSNDHQEFLSNIDMHPNRNNIKRVAVSQANERAAGLEGLVPETHPYSPQSIAKDPSKKDREIIYTVYQEYDSNTDTWHYLDKNGNRTTKVEEVVRGFLPSTSLNWGSNYDNQTRYSNSTPEEAEKYAKAWENLRNTITSSNKMQPRVPFFISEGVAVKDTTPGAKHGVINNLVTQEQLDNKQPVLKVVTGQLFQHQGRNLQLKKGSVMVQNGAILEYANNRKLNTREIDLLLKLFALYAKKSNTTTILSGGQRVIGVLDPQITKFLQGILYFESPYKTKDDVVTKQELGRNQFYIHQGKLFFGSGEVGIDFDEAVLSNPNQNQVLRAYLSGVYLHVNNTLLQSNKRFEEITNINPDGTVESRMWPSYQHYLLSSQYPDGTTRNIVDIPLSTKILPQQANKTRYINRYSFSYDMMKVETKPTASKEEQEKAKQAAQKLQQPKVKTLQVGGQEVKYEVTNGDINILSTQEELAPLLAKIEALPFMQELISNLRKENEIPEGEALPDNAIATILEIEMDMIKKKLKEEHDKSSKQPSTPTTPTQSVGQQLDWYNEVSKIDPLDQSPENVARVQALRDRMPEDLTEQDLTTLLTSKGDFSTFLPYRALVEGIERSIGERSNEFSKLDERNSKNGTQKVKLLDLFNQGLITYTEENGDIC